MFIREKDRISCMTDGSSLWSSTFDGRILQAIARMGLALRAAGDPHRIKLSHRSFCAAGQIRCLAIARRCVRKSQHARPRYEAPGGGGSGASSKKRRGYYNICAARRCLDRRWSELLPMGCAVPAAAYRPGPPKQGGPPGVLEDALRIRVPRCRTAASAKSLADRWPETVRLG